MFGWEKKGQKKLADLFSEYVRPELLDAMTSPDFNPPLNTFREVRINFILVSIHGPQPTEIGKGIGLIADMTKKHGWYIDWIFSNLVMLIDGEPMPTAPQRSSRSELVSQLREQMGHKIKFLHGERIAPWGHYGSSHRSTYGVMLHDFSELLASLHAQPYGTGVEIAP